jgi:hypothetical protein
MLNFLFFSQFSIISISLGDNSRFRHLAVLTSFMLFLSNLMIKDGSYDLIFQLFAYWNLWFCDSEKQKVQSYRQKISKWQGQVSERLQALNRRAGLHLFQQFFPFPFPLWLFQGFLLFFHFFTPLLRFQVAQLPIRYAVISLNCKYRVFSFRHFCFNAVGASKTIWCCYHST